MKIDPQKYHRKSVRLNGYDYTLPGAYFITLLTYHREYLFGEMLGGEMRLNRNGNIVERVWTNLPNHYPQITLEAFIVMPNHVHGIVIIHEGDDGCGRGGSETRPYESGGLFSMGGSLKSGEEMPGNFIDNGIILPDANKTHPYEADERIKYEKMMRYGLPEIVRAFKSFSAWRINQIRNMHGTAVWQRSFYDHIIRSEQDLYNVGEYIQSNPRKWEEDQFLSSKVDNPSNK